MLKYDVTYVDLNGDKQSESLYFNLFEFEIIELEAEHKGGLQNFIKRMIAAEDNKTLVAEFKRIVLLAYGVKSEDGRHFDKSEELSKKFSQSVACNQFLSEITKNEDAIAAFINGLVPDSMKQISDRPITSIHPTNITPPQPPPAQQALQLDKE